MGKIYFRCSLTVYWIHYKEHTDPKSEGYVGITSQDPKKRFRDHGCGKNIHLRNRCKQTFTTLTTLHENLSLEDAKKIEREYRPQENIGWNTAIGGGIPPSLKGRVVSEKTRRLLASFRGRTHTPETRRKLSEARMGKPLSKEHRNKLSKAKLGKCLSTETKRRISETKMGHVVSEETRERISKTFQNRSKRKSDG